MDWNKCYERSKDISEHPSSLFREYGIGYKDISFRNFKKIGFGKS